MAEGRDERQREARRRYVHERQQLPTIGVGLGVSEATLRRWKAAARLAGDDWDVARAAALAAGDSLDQLIVALIEDYVIQHQATIDALKASEAVGPADRAKILASLADSFNKTIKAAGRASPKISELGVAMDVLRRLGDYIAQHFPEHGPAFVEVLEPFGAAIAEAYR